MRSIAESCYSYELPLNAFYSLTLEMQRRIERDEESCSSSPFSCQEKQKKKVNEVWNVQLKQSMTSAKSLKNPKLRESMQ